jgi:hypothetical protein
VPALAGLVVAAGSVVFGPTGANPSRSGGGAVSVVGDGGEPSLVVPLLVFVGFVVVLAAAVQWWRHLGGWSPAEMTLTLQATGREVDTVGAAIDKLGLRSSAAGVAHRRAGLALSSVLRRDDLTAVYAALTEVRAHLELTANSQAESLQRGREREQEHTA